MLRSVSDCEKNSRSLINPLSNIFCNSASFFLYSSSHLSSSFLLEPPDFLDLDFDSGEKLISAFLTPVFIFAIISLIAASTSVCPLARSFAIAVANAALAVSPYADARSLNFPILPSTLRSLFPKAISAAVRLYICCSVSPAASPSAKIAANSSFVASARSYVVRMDCAFASLKAFKAISFAFVTPNDSNICSTNCAVSCVIPSVAVVALSISVANELNASCTSSAVEDVSASTIARVSNSE